MKYFVFVKMGKSLDHLKSFRTLKAARKYIDHDIAAMARQWPDMKWLKTDYVVARRLK